jgi:hypothetical protein
MVRSSFSGSAARAIQPDQSGLQVSRPRMTRQPYRPGPTPARDGHATADHVAHLAPGSPGSGTVDGLSGWAVNGSVCPAPVGARQRSGTPPRAVSSRHGTWIASHEEPAELTTRRRPRRSPSDTRRFARSSRSGSATRPRVRSGTLAFRLQGMTIHSPWIRTICPGHGWPTGDSVERELRSAGATENPGCRQAPADGRGS